jgi:signal transduction histidine kinase/CheY-like chemotaxis protein
MRRPVQSRLLRYGSAFVSVALMTGLWACRPVAIEHRPFVPFYCAVIFTAWYAGLGPSIVAVALSCLSAVYFFFPPILAPTAKDPGDLVAMAMFITVCSTIIAFSEANRVARRRLEQEIADRIQAENELRQSDRRKDEFLAVLSHELRNPLAPIQSALDLLEHKNREEADPELTMIARQVHHLKRLVDDLLDVSRIRRGKVDLRTAVVELGPVVVQAVEAVRPLFAEQKQDFQTSIAREAIYIEADPTRIEQVLVNLLLNASRYTPRRGRVWLEVGSEQQQAVIRVRDTGIGMEPDLLPKVFDLFQQGDRKTGRSHVGCGIGLNLAKKLVELHEGTITASSAGANQGSEFVIRLPCVAPAPTETPRIPQVVSVDNAQVFPRWSILIVDDNVQAADSLGKLMSVAFGQDVQVVYRGERALEVAKWFLPHLVLLDLELGGMDGYEVATRLREHPECSRTLMVAVTGWGNEDDRHRSREIGLDLHLVKPVTAKDLRAMLVELQPRLEEQILPLPIADFVRS